MAAKKIKAEYALTGVLIRKLERLKKTIESLSQGPEQAGAIDDLNQVIDYLTWRKRETA